MVIEHYRPGKAPEIYRRFRDQGRLAPAGLNYISSWVDLDFNRCFQVMEAANEDVLKEWTDHWSDLVEFEIVPVRTSEQAHPRLTVHTVHSQASRRRLRHRHTRILLLRFQMRQQTAGH